MAPCLVAVPSQLLLMLELAEHRHIAPISAVRLIMVSGARWNRSRTAALKALFPQARIIEFYGASETSFIAWMDAADDISAVPSQAVGKPFSNVEIEIRPTPKGLIHVRSPMLFMDYVSIAGGAGADHSAALRDGDWLSVRDVGVLDANGWLCLEGRENRMIVTLGKNLFPEELEGVLETHAAVAQASVHGVADPLRGTQVVAVLRLRSAVQAGQLSAHCRAHLEGFKTPRRYLTLVPWPQTPGGKTDHRAIAQALQHPTDSPCLLPLH
jgi:acyl-CoA synthetase (AMP-forming)/AMP-acid ligase II